MLTAQVAGSGPTPYAVRIRETAAGTNLDVACDCPYEGGVCKHIVAVLLTYLEQTGQGGPQPDELLADRDGDDEDDAELARRLQDLEPETLIRLVLELARTYPDIRTALLLATRPGDARATARGADPNVKSLTRAVRHAFRSREFIDHYQMPKVMEALDRVKAAARFADPLARAEVYWAIIDQGLKAFQRADDSDGMLGSEVSFTLEEFVRAFLAANPTAEARRRRLQDLFRHLISHDYGLDDALLSATLALCQEATDYDWLLTALQERLESGDLDHYQRRKLRQHILSIHRYRGDDERYLALRQAYLEDALDYLELARYWQERGQPEQAIAALEEGLRQPGVLDFALLQPLAGLYQQESAHQ